MRTGIPTMQPRKCPLSVTSPLVQRGLGSPGTWNQQAPPGSHQQQHSQQAGWGGSARRGSVTQLTACLPVFGCVEAIRKSSFLSLPNISHPPLCSPLCPPGPVSRTAAVSGADGLGACERTTCSQCSLLPGSLPPTSASPASSCSHIKPCFSLCPGFAGILRGARFHTTVSGDSQLVSGLCQASPVFPTKPTFPLAPHAPPPTPFLTLPVDKQLLDGHSKEGEGAARRAGP